MTTRSALAALAITAAAISTACGGRPIQPWEYQPRPMADTLAIFEPDETQPSLVYEQVYGVFSGLGRVASVNRKTGLPPALNADPFDEVVNSAWFTNRNARDPLSPDGILRGPQASEGPDQSGEVTIWSIKAEGVTPGFWIEDAAGVRWILKFDPPENWEMGSGAEVVATNLFWAAGYHTPENHVYYLDPSRLVLDDELDAEFPEAEGMVEYRVGADDPARELTMDVFRRHILDRYPTSSDGMIRAMASRFLPGAPKGPFDYAGLREDDPNDVIPHEHRRELRGLYVMAAWLNHVDAKKGNTQDMFIVDPRSPEGDDAPAIGYLRHHLLDFGSALGSGSVHPHNPRHGSEHDFDASAILLRLVTFGAYKRPWQKMLPYPEWPPSIGFYSIDGFNPADWRSNIVNPAFINRTARDGYWGAKLVMSFTDAQLDAAARAGRYSEPDAAAYLLEGLKERRDATGRYWFRQVSSLDRPRVEGGAVVFDDLWARHFGGSARYEYALDWDDGGIDDEGEVTSARIPLPAPAAGVPTGGDSADDHLRLEVRKVFDDGGRADRPATIWLAWDGSAYRVVGVRY
ncbi:MAG TPA: hypothetical protein VM778_09120 [Gemmatimonadota bacterium]|nr:hypothetical protein [Gemmatimonadota bacterium]